MFCVGSHLYAGHQRVRNTRRYGDEVVQYMANTWLHLRTLDKHNYDIHLLEFLPDTFTTIQRIYLGLLVAIIMKTILYSSTINSQVLKSSFLPQSDRELC